MLWHASLPKNIPSYGYTAFYLSVYQIIRHLDCFHFLAVVANVCKSF